MGRQRARASPRRGSGGAPVPGLPGLGDLRFADLSIDPSERRVGCYAGEPRAANYSGYGLASANTLRSWLAMWSLTTSDCRAEPHLARITDPALVVQSTGDQECFPSDARAIFDGLASPDKRLEWLSGDRYFCERPDGRATVAAFIAGWLAEHGAD